MEYTFTNAYLMVVFILAVPSSRYSCSKVDRCCDPSSVSQGAKGLTWSSPKLLLKSCINFEHLFNSVHLSLMLNQFLLYVTFQYPLKSSRKHWKNELILPWWVFDGFHFWFLAPSPPVLYAHVPFWATPFLHVPSIH